MIIFKEHNVLGYKSRTLFNAKADITIAFAINFNSFGEILTRNSVLKYQKTYIPVNVSTLEIDENLVNLIVESMNKSNVAMDVLTGERLATLNIAGNGIYTMKGIYTQNQCDEYVFRLLKKVLEDKNLKIKIVSVVTGGQTGFDEAGSKAAERLGIKSTILAPKGWLFRNENGKDIADEKLFKSRFS